MTGGVAGMRLRFRAAPGAVPLGAIFGGVGALFALAVAGFGLDRMPVTLCVFRSLTGLPCPTCGTTRAAGRLAALDLPGALAVNPLATVLALALAAWALADALLLLRREALALEIGPSLGRALRVLAVPLILGNWLYLLLGVR